MSKESQNALGVLVLVSIIAFMMIMVKAFPKYTMPYSLGVSDTHKAAFEKGYMTKEITKDDEVIYKWK